MSDEELPELEPINPSEWYETKIKCRRSMITEGSESNLKQYFSYHVPDLEDMLYSIEYNPGGTRFSFDKFKYLLFQGGKITKECSIKACQNGNCKVFRYIRESSPEMVDEDCLIHAIKR
jgi:hypothetical protein